GLGQALGLEVGLPPRLGPAHQGGGDDGRGGEGGEDETDQLAAYRSPASDGSHDGQASAPGPRNVQAIPSLNDSTLNVGGKSGDLGAGVAPGSVPNGWVLLRP